MSRIEISPYLGVPNNQISFCLVLQTTKLHSMLLPQATKFHSISMSPTPAYHAYQALCWPRTVYFNRQLSGTLKWSAILMLWTPKWSKIWLFRTPKPSEILLLETPNWSENSNAEAEKKKKILKFFKSIFVLIFFF